MGTITRNVLGGVYCQVQAHVDTLASTDRSDRALSLRNLCDMLEIWSRRTFVTDIPVDLAKSLFVDAGLENGPELAAFHVALGVEYA